jgi:hypothetical protein
MSGIRCRKRLYCERIIQFYRALIPSAGIKLGPRAIAGPLDAGINRALNLAGELRQKAAEKK